jgi:diguanylate cyclase (GGDEF)-like protein/PAS domain S-box-containing protein
MNIINNWLKKYSIQLKLKQIARVKNDELKRKIKQLEEIEQELRASKARQKAIFDAQPDATIISDENGIIVTANTQVEILLGYNATELVGQPIEILIPPRFRPNHPQLRKSYCNAPYPRFMGMGFPNVMALRKDQTDVEVEISLSPIHTEQGILFASSLRDVTARKEIEAALKASEERFRLMANYSSIMIWITDTKGEPTFSNQAWLDFVGWKKETVTHNEWQQLVHPDDLKTAFTHYFGKTKEHKIVSTEYRLRGANGQWLWVLDKGVPMFNDEGVFIGYIGSLLDINEHKNAQAELRIASIAFESNEAMLITDANSTILRVNAAFTKLTGYSAEELVGQKTSFLRSGHHDDKFYTEMWETIKRDGTWQGEIWDRRKNGEIYPKWLVITAVKNAEGEITNYVGAQSDITERKATDQKMRDLAYYDPLTKLPNRRLLHERLEHSILMAQRLNKQFAILMLDLDKFKAVNDSLGHLAGDELLQQVAVRLSGCLRESDTVARLGGDEFIVLLENVKHPDDAGLIAKNITITMAAPFTILQNHTAVIGSSVGISIFPQDGDDPVKLIANADFALYQAKTNGRGCFVYFSDLKAQI